MTSRAGLATRLLAAQVLVLLAAVVTAWSVALAVGPRIFHDHLSRVPVAHESPQESAFHAEQAFQDASVIAIGVGLLVALLVAAAVSVWVTRRIAGSVEHLADAATDIASGHYDVTLPRPRLGREFDQLAGSFADMAARLGSVEATRRRLLADLAHEMRTPLATLGGYLEAVEDGVQALDPPTIALLRSQTARLERLARDVSSVSRAEEHQVGLERRPVAVADLVGTAVAAAGDRFAERGVALAAAVDDGSGAVDVDPDRLGQVLGNLLDNALRHTPAGGRVEVAARRSGADVVVEVRDDGEGIAAEHLPHVFERFYRADAARDRAHGGSGIGLAIVKALVEAHGGRVAAASDGPGRGTTVAVTLPAARTRAPQPSPMR